MDWAWWDKELGREKGKNNFGKFLLIFEEIFRMEFGWVYFWRFGV